MIKLRLPDGSTKEVEPGLRSLDVAEQILPKKIVKKAIAAKVNDVILDLERELPANGDDEIPFQILLDKDREALDVLRHSCAHVMARAVMRLFPNVQLAFGPTIENGFYYDIDCDPPIREEDFPRIEEEMKKIVEEAEPFERFERPIDQAVKLCDDLHQGYKVEHINETLKQQGESVSFYRQGEFIDLCRGPHIPNAGKIGAFKVLSIAGAYWKNDASRKQLQRLYGTAFFRRQDLDAYLHQLAEAKKRDHRVLGKQLKLFTISQTVGSGLILWQPKGANVRNILESFIKDELLKRGYDPVYTPHIGRLDLYRTSGHFPYYRDSQFPPMYFRPAAGTLDLIHFRMSACELDEQREQFFKDYFREAHFTPPGYLEAKSNEEQLSFLHDATLRLLETIGVDLPEYHAASNWEDRAAALRGWLEQQEGYLLKPMNCPHHIQIYKAEPRSYRDLPVRLAELGTVYRFEQTGELSGMTRVRGFTQDDAHLFITPEQIEEELQSNIDLVQFILKSLGLNDYRVRVGLRDSESDKWVGEFSDWEQAQSSLVNVVKGLGMNYSEEVGEAAFYGPKIDFVVRDCIGREWQLGTVQLDYNLPKRFDLEYVGSDNQPHRPVMIHRAPFGSMERFMGILIEHFAGAFPLWLAPEQARVCPISDKFNEYGQRVEAQLKAAGYRLKGDYRPEKIGYKIREAKLEKIPYVLVVGEKEQSAGTVAVNDRVDGDLGPMPVAELLERLRKEIDEKTIREISTASAGLADTSAKFVE